MWYQRDFTYRSRPGHKTFLHIGAANYKSIAWVNGQKVCSHEGGFTDFDCDVSSSVRAGKNFVVIAVDNTRLADGVPTLNTDWWNYGGLTRDVSLIDVPAKYIDDYDLHLNRDRTAIVGSVHVEGADAGRRGHRLASGIGPQRLRQTWRQINRATISLSADGVAFWTPEHPKLYKVHLQAGEDTLDDEMGFRTIEVRGTDILLNGKPVFLRGISIHARSSHSRRPRQ